VNRSARRRFPPAAPPSRATSGWPWGIAASAVAFLLYLPALRHGFVWDDPLVLEQLRSIRGLRDLIFPPETIPRYYYRPLIFASFLLDRFIGGEQPFWFHLSVVLGHTFNTFLVFALGVSLFGHLHASALAALLFATHPVHVESVAWIAGRSDVLATLFLLLSALLAMRDRPSWAPWLAAGTYALALLSKEVAIAGLLLLPLLGFCAGRRHLWPLSLTLVGVTSAYALLRRAALGAALTGAPTGASASELVQSLIAAVGFYAGVMVWPVGLSAYVPEVQRGAFAMLAGVCAGLGIGVGVWLCWRHGQRAAAALLVWIALTLAPSLVVIVRASAQTALADRYVYLPSVGACLALIPLVARLERRRRNFSFAAAILVASLYAVSSWNRIPVWANDLVFWQDAAAKSPEHALAHRELAMAYMDRNQLPQAEAAFQLALAGKSDRDGRVMTLNNVGLLFLRQQRLGDAERVFDEALRLYPHPYLYYGLGRVAMNLAEQAQARADSEEVRRQVVRAREFLQKSLELDSTNPKAHVLLGQVLFALQDNAAARQQMQLALDLGARGGIADAARHYLRIIPP
jgi:tetratricopeptide (TPR) repeat protein